MRKESNQFEDQEDRNWVGIEWECVWICVDCSPLISQCRLPWFLAKRRWTIAVLCLSSETNGGMDRFGAQSCKFATARVNLQISYLFSPVGCQEEAQHRKRQNFDGFCDFWQILRSSRDFLNRGLSDDCSRRAVSLEIAYTLIDF